MGYKTPMDSPDASPIIELIEAFRRSKAMFAAVSLGIFDSLERKPGDLGLSPRNCTWNPNLSKDCWTLASA